VRYKVGIKVNTVIKSVIKSVNKNVRNVVKMTTMLVFTTAFVMSLFTPLSVQAQDIQPMLDRIDRLERDIRALNIFIAQGQNGEPPALVSTGGDVQAPASTSINNAGVARIDARITSLENDVRVATGAMEEIDHRIFQISNQMNKAVADMEFRLNTLEHTAANAALNNTNNAMPSSSALQSSEMAINTVPPVSSVTSVTEQSSTGILGTITETQLKQIQNKAAALTDGTDGEQPVDPNALPTLTTQQAGDTPAVGSVPEVQTLDTQQAATAAANQAASAQKEYTAAFGLLRQAKYDDAAMALQQFIDTYSDDPLTANARYWLGETYYVRSQYVKAAEVFFEGYRANPDGIKAPDTLLKLGMSLSNLGKKPEACAAFAKLASEFNDASASVRTTLQREQVRNECG
jgi:tol-pal system protein YbgF